MSRTKSLVVALTLLLFFAGLQGCGPKSRKIRVGSKDFAEQLVIGELYALAIENAGLPVERRFNLGGTPVAHRALETDEIDLYPEYTGTALLTVLKLPTQTDPEKTFETVAANYQSRFNFVWLDRSPMNNTQAIAMKRDAAARLGIATLGDFAAKASQLALIGSPEFELREDGLPGLVKAYGQFPLKKYVAVDSGLRYKGLLENQADAVVAYGTDGEIAAYDLVLLTDDRKLFPPYQVAPVIRQSTLAAFPGIRTALAGISVKLTDEAMRTMNLEVTGKGRDPADVAREFWTRLKEK